MISNQINAHIARELGTLDREHRVHVKKLSTGKRILAPGDDAGGYSLAVKHASVTRRHRAAVANVQNAYSYAQTQTGVLSSVGKAYKRMDELAMMVMDPVKTDADRDLHDKEFQELRDAVVRMSLEKFNDLRLFRGKEYSLVDKGKWFNWDEAKAEVDALDASDQDNNHYLATVTSEEEQFEISLQLGSSANGINAWLGGRDAVDSTDPKNPAATDPAEEGQWRWTEGPEGEEDGGMGRIFWNGAASGSPVNDAFNNWAPRVDGTERVRAPKTRGEPNNSGGEHFLQISQRPGWEGTEPGDTGVGGWNDLPMATPKNSTYGVQGYLMETDQGGLSINNGEAGETFSLSNVSFLNYLDKSLLSIATVADAKDAIGKLKIALESVADAQAQAGANLSRLGKDVERLTAKENNFEAARSRVEDLDIAIESGRLSRKSIKLQSTSALLAQANEIMNPNLIQILLE
jgi:flagellin-like hook-associated protein FlgL